MPGDNIMHKKVAQGMRGARVLLGCSMKDVDGILRNHFDLVVMYAMEEGELFSYKITRKSLTDLLGYYGHKDHAKNPLQLMKNFDMENTWPIVRKDDCRIEVTSTGDKRKKQIEKLNSIGVNLSASNTSIPFNRIDTDMGIQFLKMLEPGSKVIINIESEEDGKYILKCPVSNSKCSVDKNKIPGMLVKSIIDEKLEVYSPKEGANYNNIHSSVKKFNEFVFECARGQFLAGTKSSENIKIQDYIKSEFFVKPKSGVFYISPRIEIKCK